MPCKNCSVRVTVSRLVLTMMAISWCVGGITITNLPEGFFCASRLSCAQTRWNELGSASMARWLAASRIRSAMRVAMADALVGVENISSRASSRPRNASRDGATAMMYSGAGLPSITESSPKKSPS